MLLSPALYLSSCAGNEQVKVLSPLLAGAGKVRLTGTQMQDTVPFVALVGVWSVSTFVTTILMLSPPGCAVLCVPCERAAEDGWTLLQLDGRVRGCVCTGLTAAQLLLGQRPWQPALAPDAEAQTCECCAGVCQQSKQTALVETGGLLRLRRCPRWMGLAWPKRVNNTNLRRSGRGRQLVAGCVGRLLLLRMPLLAAEGFDGVLRVMGSWALWRRCPLLRGDVVRPYSTNLFCQSQRVHRARLQLLENECLVGVDGALRQCGRGSVVCSTCWLDCNTKCSGWDSTA